MARLFPDPKVKHLYEDGFDDDDFLNRRQTGEALSNLLNQFEEPLVVALDSQWGSGKTWFLQRWVGEHIKANATSIVVYFDAFAHDYISNPLPALVSGLEGRTKDKKTFKAIKKVAFKVVQAGVRVGTAVATSGLSEADALANSFSGEAEKQLEEFWKLEEGRSKAMEEFRTALESLVSGENGNEVIIVIDELDRCRPDYALEVLEVIKHFFSVDNVHFVLGVNLRALEDMVSARYGAKDYATEYLQKFIQVKLELPEEAGEGNPKYRNVSRYLDFLCREMKIPDHISMWLKIRIKLVSRNNFVSLRQIEHIVSAVALANPECRRANNRGGIFPDGRYGVMVDLIVSRIVCPKLYPRFLDATITPDELESYLGYSADKPTLYPIPQGIQDTIPDQGFDFDDWKWAYDTWLLITQIENEIPVLGNVIPDRKREIGQTLFGRDFVPKNISEYKINELPKKIQREWLNLFRFYKSDP